MSNKELTFEESMARLETIVSTLEKNEQSLDETIKLFEEGLQLVQKCDGQLKEYESKVNSLLNGGEEKNG